MCEEDPSILIVDADQATRELYQRELARAYRVFVSGNQQEALAVLQSQRIQVAVIEPASLDGEDWALLASISHDPEANSVPVVLCSALDERRKGMALGAAAYLIKPVTPAELLETIDRVLASGRDANDFAQPTP